MPWSVFECWVLSQLFSRSSYTLIKRLFSSSSLWAIRVLSSTYLGERNGNPLQYSCLESPVDRAAWRAAVHRVAQSWTRLKQLSMHACTGEGNGKPTPVFLPGESQGRGSLVGCRLWGRTESDTTEATWQQPQHLHIWGCWYFSWQFWFQLGLHLAWHCTWCTLHVS